MVVAVHADFTRSVDRVQTRSGNNLQHMSQILFNGIAMMQRAGNFFGDMLVESAAAQSIHQLHSGTDCQNRKTAFDGHFRNTTIEVFASLRHHFHRRMNVHLHPRGIQIQIAA